MSVSVFDRIREMVVEQLGVAPEKITPDAKFEDLGADSLDIVELMMRIEEELDVEVSDEEAEKLVTVADAVAFIEAHQS